MHEDAHARRSAALLEHGGAVRGQAQRVACEGAVGQQVARPVNPSAGHGFVAVSVVLGVAMVAETLLLLWIGWSHFGLATNTNALYTFSFLTLLYFAVFSIVSARERRWFCATLPSKTFLSAVAADALTGTVLTFVGLPGLLPLPWWQTLAIFVYAMVACLGVNDALKVAMIKWKPVDRNPQIAKRAFELYEQRGRQDGRAGQDWDQAEREIRERGTS